MGQVDFFAIFVFANRQNFDREDLQGMVLYIYKHIPLVYIAANDLTAIALMEKLVKINS